MSESLIRNAERRLSFEEKSGIIGHIKTQKEKKIYIASIRNFKRPMTAARFASNIYNIFPECFSKLLNNSKLSCACVVRARVRVWRNNWIVIKFFQHALSR